MTESILNIAYSHCTYVVRFTGFHVTKFFVCIIVIKIVLPTSFNYVLFSSQVWNHFDAGACPGQATGVRIRLDNDLSGYIHIKNLSDRHVADPTERVRIGQTVHCRILKIDVERFSVDCSSKSSDLLDKNKEWR